MRQTGQGSYQLHFRKAYPGERVNIHYDHDIRIICNKSFAILFYHHMRQWTDGCVDGVIAIWRWNVLLKNFKPRQGLTMRTEVLVWDAQNFPCALAHTNGTCLCKSPVTTSTSSGALSAVRAKWPYGMRDRANRRNLSLRSHAQACPTACMTMLLLSSVTCRCAVLCA